MGSSWSADSLLPLAIYPRRAKEVKVIPMRMTPGQSSGSTNGVTHLGVGEPKRWTVDG